jgi:hypothetical protein
MITDTQRNEAYSKANSAQIFLYSHPDSGASLQSIAGKYDLKETTIYKVFAIMVGDFILGFHDISEGVAIIQNELGISEQAAKLIQVDIKNFLAPLYNEDLNQLETPTKEVVPDISNEILEAEKEIESLQTVRTMSSDSNIPLDPQKEAAYSSVQSAILNERKQ